MNLTNILIISSIVFLVGLYGSLTKKSAVMVIMCLELMFNATAMQFVAFSRFAPGKEVLNVLSGQVMAIFIIAIGAAEVALALSLVIAVYKEKNSIEVTDLSQIKET